MGWGGGGGGGGGRKWIGWRGARGSRVTLVNNHNSSAGKCDVFNKCIDILKRNVTRDQTMIACVPTRYMER